MTRISDASADQAASNPTQADVCVIGAGIVGLATARALLSERPGTSVKVLDKEAAPARHQSGVRTAIRRPNR